MNDARQPPDDKRWKAIEKVVRLLEATLDPSATVTHDVELEDHTTGGPRQCDTVIETGIEPRRSKTIVEVQDRNEPLGIAELQSFYQKMTGVHAQQLICVTRAGYTEQALAFARNVGPTIRLLTLAELELHKWPVNFAFGRLCLIENDARPVHMNLKGSPKDNHALDRTPGTAKLDLQARIFEYRQKGKPSKVMSSSDVFRGAIDELPFHLHQEGPIKYTLSRRFGGKDRLRVKIGKRKMDVGFAEVHVEIRTKKHYVPLTMMSYEQQDYDGTLGWSALADAEIEGKRVQVRAAFVPNADGRLDMVSFEIDGVWRAAPMVYEQLDSDEKVRSYKAEVAAYDAALPDRLRKGEDSDEE